MSKDLQGCLLYLLVSLLLFIILGLVFHDYPLITILLVLSWMIGYPVSKIIEHNKKISAEIAIQEEQEKKRKQQEADYVPAKEELLAKIEKWEKDGILAIAVKDKVLNQYNDIYFLGENFYFNSPKKTNLIKGTLMFINKEICFLSDTIVKTTPYSQILKVDIGPCEIRFTSKKYQYPLSFIRVTDNQYADRLEVCDAYARYHLRNGFESKDFIEDIKTVLNLPFPNFQKVVINPNK